VNVFIVHAHPEPKSLCASMCGVAIQELRAHGHVVRVSDLYAMRFNPVASADEFVERRDPHDPACALEQRHAQPSGSLAPDIEAELPTFPTLADFDEGLKPLWRRATA
jgi:NAD(P)H dehydrogenase (quinone)